MVAVRAQVASAINFIICCERLHDGSRKTIALSEVLPLNEKGDYRTQDIFVFTPVTKDEDGHILGYHAPTGIIPNFIARARAYGFDDLDESFFDPATYGVPPAQLPRGRGYTVRWALAQAPRARRAGPRQLQGGLGGLRAAPQGRGPRRQGRQAPAPASPPVQVQVPANAPVAAPRPAAETPAPSARAPPRPRRAPRARPPAQPARQQARPARAGRGRRQDAAAHPQPLRLRGRARPLRAQPLQVSADLIADGGRRRAGDIPPPRPPARPAVPASGPPQPRLRHPPRRGRPRSARRPAPPAPARPPPPVDDLGEDDDAPRELRQLGEDTHQPIPEKPRR